MRGEGSPYAPHTAAETEAMLDAVGVEDLESLFDIPEPIRFDGAFDIEPRSEAEIRTEVADLLSRNEDLVELLGRGHYDHYVPSMVDHLADRSEFLSAYTQYQPEVQQGFLQALFEYQSMLVELTGLGVANCSMYDAATALGEAATMAHRIADSRRYDAATGDRVLVPENVGSRKREVLDSYVDGPGMTVETYPTDDGIADLDGLRERIDEDVVLVYAETPTAAGAIEENLAEIGEAAADGDALFCLGSDPVALSVLEEPAAVGADVVVGDAATLGLPTSFGMGLGLFVTHEDFLRQVPGRLVGVSEDAEDVRAYTLTLQTREQHIRRERATSNICTNQAWVALRAAMHAAWLGPHGLIEEARESITRAEGLADRIDEVVGLQAPVHDRRHFREFQVHTDQPAQPIADDLIERGFAVHVVDDHRLQVCVTGVSDDALDEFVGALSEVAK